MRRMYVSLLCCVVPAGAVSADPGLPPSRPAPAIRAMAASQRDLWGAEALRQPGGPSYEFFRDLLPPLRYVNTAFRHYPLVLCAPSAPVKARWVSNGSAVNARANSKPMWREVGVPVHFFVGEQSEPFGEDLARLDGPRYAEGYLPIAQVAYRHEKTVYEQEAFGGVRAPFAGCGGVFVRFTAREAPGVVTAHVRADAPLSDEQRHTVLLSDPRWQWDAEGQRLRATLQPGQSATLAVLTRPLPEPLKALSEDDYRQEHAACVRRWDELLAQGMQLSVPEPVVQNAWRSLVVGNFLLASGPNMNYSAGNAYDHLYESECGDATRSLLQFGFTDAARAMVVPLLKFNRPATRYHVAGHKLQLLTQYYWTTRDAEHLRKHRALWQAAVDFIVSSRQKDTGLLPRDNYAGDISQQVVSLNSNANCWRGLRDVAAVLAELGEDEAARQLAAEARSYRQAILDAVAKSERRDVQPPFIPNALFGDEGPHEPLTATRTGSYYDLMCPYIIGSGVFPPGSERETWLIEYLQQHGGVAMGMIRSTPQQGQFAGEPGVNVLYGLRYVQALLRRDDRGRALAGFYGQLAQAMTRDTFIGAEGTRFLHGDRWGRSMYLPPNSASNAMFLLTLRSLLVQDWDLDDDGRPETLRLLFAAPGRWLRDGATLAVERAPTAFGPVSVQAESRLSRGEVRVTVDAPSRPPEKLLLRVPLPEGWRVSAAQVEDTGLALAADGTVDLSGRRGRLTVWLQAKQVTEGP